MAEHNSFEQLGNCTEVQGKTAQNSSKKTVARHNNTQRRDMAGTQTN